MHRPVHAECRVNGNGVYVLKWRRARLADSARVRSRFARGPEVIGLEELLLRHALGEPTAPWTRERRASAVMMIPIPARGLFRGVRGVEDARRVPVSRMSASPPSRSAARAVAGGLELSGLHLCARGHGRRGRACLRAAHHRLEFAVQPEIAMLQSRHG